MTLTNASQEVRLAAWTLGEPHSVTLETSLSGNNPVAILTGEGGRTEAELQQGRLTLELTVAPKYATLSKRPALKSTGK